MEENIFHFFYFLSLWKSKSEPCAAEECSPLKSSLDVRISNGDTIVARMSWFSLDAISRNGELKIYWRINSEVFANYNGQVEFWKKCIFQPILDKTTFFLRNSSGVNPKPLEIDNERRRALGWAAHQSDNGAGRRDENLDWNALRWLFWRTSCCCSFNSRWLLIKDDFL